MDKTNNVITKRKKLRITSSPKTIWKKRKFTLRHDLFDKAKWYSEIEYESNDETI